MIEQYLFAQMDILGFSNLIMEPPRNISLNNIKISYEYIFKNDLLTNKQIILQNIPNYTAFSDTIFIYSKINNENILDFFKYISCILQNSITTIKKEQEKVVPELCYKFPIRGAISIGDLIIEPVLIGKPIISSYRWERVQNWLGVSLPPDVKLIDYIDKAIYEKLINTNLLINYDVPTKFGIVPTKVVNFITKDNKSMLLNIIEEEISVQTSKEVIAKYYATKLIIEYIVAKNLFLI